MDSNISDVLHSEEQLRNTLHCDDKEKLRRKLAHLQREYLETAQKLKRAERLDAVRRHVKSRISLQKQQDQSVPEVTPNSSINPSSFIINTNNSSILGSAQSQVAVDSDTSRRQQVIRFSLPGDPTCPQTPDPSNDVARSHRPSPALRLRSKRSRLLWEKRNADALQSSNDGKRQQEQTERTENARTAEQEWTIKKEDVFNESEELFSGPEFESPSLLLTHWSTQEHTNTGHKMGKENQRPQEERGKETDLDVNGKVGEPALTTEEGQNVRKNNSVNNEIGEDSVRQSAERETVACEEGSHENIEQNAAQTTGIEKHEDFVEIKEEKNQITADEKAVSLLDSCTLVEGLLFPVEYYVRTTRRMTLSQSQPDVQAVILSQLSAGRHRRSRGRRTDRDVQRSDRHTQTDLSSPTTLPTSLEPFPANTSKDFSQRSSDISGSVIPEAPFSPPVLSVRPPRGRRKGRGTGKGRPQRPQLLKQGCEQTTGDPQAPSTSELSPRFIHQADDTNTCIKPLQSPTHSCPALPSSSVSGAPTSFTAEHQEKVYPIFLKSTISRPQQMNTGNPEWQSLLLPSLYPSSETSQLSLPSLISRVKSLDILQDFHLPDDQFASLKLHKLCQVAVESGLEHFSTPSHNTRRRSHFLYSAMDPPTPCSLPLSLTPTITNSPCPNESEQTSAQTGPNESEQTSAQTGPNESEQTSAQTGPNESEQTSAQTETSGTTVELSAASLNSSTETVSVVQEFTECCKLKEHETVTQTCTVLRSSDKSKNCVGPQAQCNVDTTVCKENDVEHLDEPKVDQSTSEKYVPLENPVATNPQFEDRCITENVSLDFSESKTAEEAPISCTDSQVCKDAAAKSPVNNLNLQYSSEGFEEPTKTDFSKDRMIKNKASQFLFKSPLDSVQSPFTAPYLPSSASPVLPSLGITPNAALLTSCPSAPSLSLPPPHSPSTQDLSPPDHSPGLSITSLPASLSSPSLCSQIQGLSEPPASSDRGDGDEPAACPTPSRIQLQSSAGEMGMTTEGVAEKWLLRCTHTLEAPAGGSLVDVCCVSGPSGSLCVAAAGKWAVCLWSQTSESDWSLKHTWTFSEPVINVFPVPDSAGLLFVSLGQLEIRELRMLSCCSLRQTLICEGIIQAVVGLYSSRLVTSSDSAAGSTLQVFTLSDSSGLLSSQSLVSPGVCVSALALVEGLPDALTGADEGGHIFIWNLKTGQLLSRVLLEQGLSNTPCLRAYSYCGVLLVLLQHQFLSSLDQEEKNHMSSEEKMKPALLSLVGINPLSGKSVLVTRLCPPKGWTGRLCEVDVNSSRIVGLSQSGCVCVWELGEGGTSKTMEAPEDEDWQLVRWGEGDTLVIGHQNGDVSLRSYSVGRQAEARTDTKTLLL
ncbi:partner and localizer of BRCA2 isoform X2 [Girardinichthys multiradiatus]|uniref:partner and localizer of BRCA2 isoform X2 n=1 Tax=Girardinichthys multiradiatus TaxID=208333 RepID=UPI001FAB539C|nr:partner and localizer of BRCA2 isoform X2 [Girardinichthys multiradiatus]